ncbi:hypothetical protein BJ170DRAFT_114747 [Xylariales sp. AK1849]|nr:hypothetical protein BJ170DRAFT_114747 [Xylariales sp. AK1849]
MAKDRADKPAKDKSKKREKKVSEDKVKKPKKEKKVKRVLTPQESDADSDASVDAAIDEQNLDESSAVSPKKLAKEVKKAKKDKKDKKEKKEKKGQEKEDTRMKTKTATSTKKEAQRATSSSPEESDSDSSSETSDDENVKSSIKAALKGPVEVEPNSLFAIDVNPTPINQQAIATGNGAGEGADGESKAEGEEATHMNRQARRRLQLIGKQREALRKSMGIAPGSDEKSEELETELKLWTARMDDKAAVRAEKKKIRKEKDAQRLRNKRGKPLKGRRLKERTKQLVKIEKKAGRKATKGTISAS